MPKHFIKPPEEEVVCEHCGHVFTGGGYVDHCPQCLWSKHVDQEVPGDRKSDCQGMMVPVSAEVRKRGKVFILYVCKKCGHSSYASQREEDNLDKIINLFNPGVEI